MRMNLAPLALLAGASLLQGEAVAADRGVAAIDRAVGPGFVENRGQYGADARFVLRGGAVTTWAADDAVWLQAAVADDGKPAAVANVRMTFEGADRVTPIGEDRRPGRVHHLVGARPDAWTVDLATFGGVRYPSIYPGVDLSLHDQGGGLEYDLLLQPGADAGQIAVRCDGVDGLFVDEAGRLVLRTPLGDLVQGRPETFRVGEGGVRAPVDCRFRLLDASTFGFEVRGADPSDRLVIDPTVSFTTYLGGTGSDLFNSVAVGADGAIYATGQTLSTSFPTTAGVFDTTFNGAGVGATDVVISKLDPTGSILLYSTYLGGTDSDTFIGEFGCDIRVDAAGQATVIGTTSATDFPTTAGAFQTVRKGDRDGFATRLAADGASLVFSTYLGGSGVDNAVGLELDASGNAYITGDTSSTDLPLSPNAFDTTISGLSVIDGFIAVLAADGSALTYASLFGGDATELGTAITVDADGVAYVTGRTASVNFDITPGAFSQLDAGSEDLLAIKVDPLGPATPAFSTAFGGSNLDAGNAITVDAAGNIYVAGGVRSFDFLVTPDAIDVSIGGLSDAFVSKLTPDATGLIYSTYLGGSASQAILDEQAFGVAIDPQGNMIVVGRTDSADFPTAGDDPDTTLSGNTDGFVTRIAKDGKSLLYSSFVGGGLDDSCAAVAVAAEGETAVVGQSSSTDLAVTPGVLQSTFAGGYSDAFVMGLDFGCKGGFEPFGFGCPGVNGTPSLAGEGCPDPGGAVQLIAANGPSFAFSLLLIGVPGGPNLPVGDSCTLQIGFLTPLQVVIPLNAQGGFKLNSSIPQDATPGVVNLQLLIADPSAGFSGISGTNPVRLQIGDV